MLNRKKMLKIQERLGMRIGIPYGIKSNPVAKTPEEVLNALVELYKIGFRAFLLPEELFSGIKDLSDLYKEYYGDLLRIKTIAKKYDIELAIHKQTFSEIPDEELKIFCNISSVMDSRSLILHPTFYKRMPKDQILQLVIYKINEILNEIKVKPEMGIETTGRINEVGSLEDVLDIVKRTRETEPILNWGHIHARGVGALRTESDFRMILDKVRSEIGQPWLRKAYFLFCGVSYDPSGLIRHISIEKSDLNIIYLIREIMSLGIKGTLILEDPEREEGVLKIIEKIEDAVR